MMQERMIFAAVLVLLCALIFVTDSWLWFVLLIIWLIRLVYLEKEVQWVLLGIALLSMMIFTLHHINRVQINEADAYVLNIDPYMMTVQNKRLIGEATLIQDGRRYKVTLVDWSYLDDKPSKTEQWHVKGKIVVPPVARNFGVFDYRKYLYSKGIDYQLEIKEVVQRVPLNSIKAYLLNWRQNILAHFQKLDSITLFSLYNRLIWNLNSTVYKAQREQMIELGIIHFFALSGLHVTLLMKQLDYFLRRIGVVNEFGIVIQYIMLGIYAFLTGFPIGIVRAGGMSLIKRIWRCSNLDALSILLIGLLWLQPRLVLNIGFQLSFIISLVLSFDECIDSERNIKQQFIIGTGCLLFSWAIILPYGHVWYPLQIIWGLLFGFVFGKLLLPFTIVLTILSFFSVRAEALLALDISKIFNLFQKFSIGFVVGDLSLVWQIALFLVAYQWLKDWRKGIKWGLFIYASLVLVGGSYLYERVTIMDVGQGDGMIYQPRFSHGGWLIDTGGQPNWQQTEAINDDNHGRQILLPALKALGVRYLDGIILTHADYDHIGNLGVILSEYKVGVLIVNEQTAEDVLFKEMVKQAKKMPEIYIMKQEKSLQLPYVPIEIWSGRISEDKNDSSLISRLKIGELSLLNMGDASIKIEDYWRERAVDMQADLLKVGHHGSNTSTSEEWLKYIQPKIGLISAGVNNRYGHPHNAVVERLQKHHIQILQTNRHGAIQLSHLWWGGERIRTAIEDDAKSHE